MNPTQMRVLRGEKYESDKKLMGGDRRSDQYSESVRQSDELKKPTREIISEQFGVSQSTIDRDARFARVMRTLPCEARENILLEKDKMTLPDVAIIDKMDAPTRNKFLKEVEKGTPIKEAVKKVDPELKRKERDDP